MEPHSGSAVKLHAPLQLWSLARFNGAALWERGETEVSRHNWSRQRASMEPHSGSAVKLTLRREASPLGRFNGAALWERGETLLIFSVPVPLPVVLQWSRTLGAR